MSFACERPLCADVVAKVFLGWRTKILRAADAFCARRREGPDRFIQSRSRTSVVALQSDAATEKSKDRLSRDFSGCSIFDFCNNICQQETRAPQQLAAYSITSSARASSVGGTSRPSDLAVLRLITSQTSETTGFQACWSELQRSRGFIQRIGTSAGTKIYLSLP
jgi:hypothetical protein